MKVEDILKDVLFETSLEKEWEEPLGFDKETWITLLNYIADLQRKEYNNSKAIEYIHEKQKIQYKYALSHIECDELEDILEKGE